MRRLNVLLLSTCLFMGCAVGPDFSRPKPPESAHFTKDPVDLPRSLAGKSQVLTQKDVPSRWWEMFHNQALNALVEEALKNNPDLKSAGAALRQAAQNVSAQQTAYFPTVQAQFEPSRQENAAVIAPTLSSNERLFNLYTPQVNASWTPDIFGANRRQVEALKAQAEYQRFEYEAAYLTLTSNLVAAAIQEAGLREQIRITNEVIAVETEELGIIRKQFAYDVVPEANVIAQQTALLQAQAALPPLKKQLAQQRDMISALTGRLPDYEPDQIFELRNIQLPGEIPLSLPSQLVDQRPDIRAAEAQLHEASANVGVAIANMLPNITLTATGGSTATQFSQLFTSGTGFFGLFGNVTQTIFDAGSLIHKKRAADAALEQAASQYESTVVTAFRNVADSLRALQFDSEAADIDLAAEKSAKASMDIARKQVQLGSAGYITLLAAKQTYQQSAMASVQAQAARYSDTAVLIQALGGGWWNRKNGS